MTTPTDIRALCAELLDELDFQTCRGEVKELKDRARAALAAEPEPPDTGEVAELVDRLRRASDGASAMGWDQDSWTIARAAELLERLAPQPVPEGPPDDELLEWAADSDDIPPEFLDPDSGRWERAFSSEEFCATVRAALARWGQP